MNIYYVYAHLDPRNDQIRYIGKGKKKRAYKFYDSRFGHHKNWISMLKTQGLEPKVLILKDCLTEAEAFELEKQYIGSPELKPYLTNGTNGGEGCSGRILSLESRKKIATANTGKSPTLEVRQKMSKAKKGNKLSESVKSKISISNKENHVGVKNPNYGKLSGHRKPIVCIETNVIFLSIQDAATKLSLHRENIRKHLQGKRSHVGGLTFKFEKNK